MTQPHIYERSRLLNTAPCKGVKGVVSHRAQLYLGVFGFLPTTHARANAKQMRSRSLRASWRFMHVYLHVQIAVHAGNIRTDEIPFFDYGKKPEDPQFEPHHAAEIKMAQVLGSLVYICGPNTSK